MKNIIVSSLLFVGIVHCQGSIPREINLPGTQPAVTAPSGQIEATPAQAEEPVLQEQATSIFQDCRRVKALMVSPNVLQKNDDLMWLVMELGQAMGALESEEFACKNDGNCDISEKFKARFEEFAKALIAVDNGVEKSLNLPEKKEIREILSKYIR